MLWSLGRQRCWLVVGEGEEVLQRLLNSHLCFPLLRMAFLIVEDLHEIFGICSYAVALGISFIQGICNTFVIVVENSSILHQLDGGLLGEIG